MPFSMSKMGHLSPMLILLLMMVSVCMASQQPKHICQYDEMRKNDPILHVIQNLPTEDFTESETATVVSDSNWKPIRILVSFHQLNDVNRQCKRKKQVKEDVYGHEYSCTQQDILTEHKKKDIKRVVYSAVKVHASRLKVVPVKHGFTLPYFHSGFCSRLDIPDDHHENGVSGADMVLYVSVKPFSLGTGYGYGFPCAIDKMSHRPLVGGLFINTLQIIATDYTVRALAHEIAHALGFDHEIMSKQKLVQSKPDVRNKPHVNEFRGNKVVAKVKEHYGCDSATGMEFEDEVKSSKNKSLGSLWESRNAKDELMAGVVRKGLYTYFTLAFFEDLGFYKADYTNAEHMDWGYKMGCEFLTRPCIENGKSNFPTMFCTEKESNALFCTANGRTMGKCVGFVTNEWNHYPSYFQYFSDKRMTGVSYLLTDQCPYIEEDKQANCRNGNQMSLSGKIGENSWCLPRTREETKSTSEGHRGVCAELTGELNQLNFIFTNEGAQEKCKDNLTPLSAPNPFDGMKLNCPSFEVLKRTIVENPKTFITSEDEMNDFKDNAQFVVADTTQPEEETKNGEEKALGHHANHEEGKSEDHSHSSTPEEKDDDKSSPATQSDVSDNSIEAKHDQTVQSHTDGVSEGESELHNEDTGDIHASSPEETNPIGSTDGHEGKVEEGTSNHGSPQIEGNESPVSPESDTHHNTEGAPLVDAENSSHEDGKKGETSVQVEDNTLLDDSKQSIPNQITPSPNTEGGKEEKGPEISNPEEHKSVELSTNKISETEKDSHGAQQDHSQTEGVTNTHTPLSTGGNDIIPDTSDKESTSVVHTEGQEGAEGGEHGNHDTPKTEDAALLGSEKGDEHAVQTTEHAVDEGDVTKNAVPSPPIDEPKVEVNEGERNTNTNEDGTVNTPQTATIEGGEDSQKVEPESAPPVTEEISPSPEPAEHHSNTQEGATQEPNDGTLSSEQGDVKTEDPKSVVEPKKEVQTPQSSESGKDEKRVTPDVAVSKPSEDLPEPQVPSSNEESTVTQEGEQKDTSNGASPNSQQEGSEEVQEKQISNPE